MAKRELHPAMKARGEQVKATWARLKTDPAFGQLSTKDRFLAVNAHLKASASAAAPKL